MSIKKNSPAAYTDVKIVMDKALEIPGLQYRLPTVGQAVNFKARCNRYRNLLRKQQEELVHHIPGERAQTAYDILIIRQVNAEGVSDRQGKIVVLDHQTVVGELFDAEGNPISLDEPTAPEEAPKTSLGLFTDDR